MSSQPRSRIIRWRLAASAGSRWAVHLRTDRPLRNSIKVRASRYESAGLGGADGAVGRVCATNEGQRGTAGAVPEATHAGRLGAATVVQNGMP